MKYWRRDGTLVASVLASYMPFYQAASLQGALSGLELLGEASVVR